MEVGDELPPPKEELGHRQILEVQPVDRRPELQRLGEDLILVDTAVVRRVAQRS